MSKKIKVGTWVVWKSGPPWKRQASIEITFLEKHLYGKHKKGPFLATKGFAGGRFFTLKFWGKPLTVPYSSEPHAFDVYWLEPATLSQILLGFLRALYWLTPT